MIYEGEPCDARPIWASDAEKEPVTDEDVERGRLEHGWLLCTGTVMFTGAPPADAPHRWLECGHFPVPVLAQRCNDGAWATPGTEHVGTWYILYKYAIDAGETDELCMYKHHQINQLVLYGNAGLCRTTYDSAPRYIAALTSVSPDVPNAMVVHGLYRRPLCNLK